MNFQSQDPRISRRAQSERGALYEFLRVPAKSSFKRLILRTAPWRAYTMSSTKSNEGLKDSECKKGQLAIWPPISYVPPTDLRSSTESETIKVRLLFLNYICGIETLHVVSKRHYKFLKSHSVMLEKQGIFVYVLFHSLACYFENRLCRSDFASCCFETTPCGFENTLLVETISYHIFPIISIP